MNDFTESSHSSGFYTEGLLSPSVFSNKARHYIDTAEQWLCMIAIDIKHFKLYNEWFGRDGGDFLLLKFSRTLVAFTKANGGIVTYYGGDNFAVVMPDDNALISKLDKQLYKCIKQNTKGEGFSNYMGIYPIKNSTKTIDTLYDRATTALNCIRADAFNRISRYNSEMSVRLDEEMRILNDFHRGLREKEFTIYIQPKVDIRTEQIVGAEALARWNHKTKGLIGPGGFIPVLDKHGFTVLLDKYIWDITCKYIRNLLDRGLEPVPVSVNVTKLDLFTIDVPKEFNRLVKKYNIPRKYIEIEITESVYSHDYDTINKTISSLRNSGYLVSMDDFGSKYSSLNMLRNVSVDMIKLDLNFLKLDSDNNKSGYEILDSVVNMAITLGIVFIVEGVETSLQLDFLRKIGCSYAQGFHFYKPMPTNEFEALLSNKSLICLSGFEDYQLSQLHSYELTHDNMLGDVMLNNLLGPISFYNMIGDSIEITRVNEQYCRLTECNNINTSSKKLLEASASSADNLDQLITFFNKAYENKAQGSEGVITFYKSNGDILKLLIRSFFMSESGNIKRFVASFTNVTAY